MVSRATISLQRWVSILLFIFYDLLQIFVVGHLKIDPDPNLIFRYTVRWSPEFTLTPLTIAFLFVIPFLISYIFAIGSISNGQMVQVIGPDSLLKRVSMEFHRGNPEGKDFNRENVKELLDEMATGEPEGTRANLEMLFSLALLVNDLIEKAGASSVKRVYVSDDLAPNAFTLRVIPLPIIGSDWIIVNRNVVDILDQDEIRAVVAHEIGHAIRKDSWINSILYSPRLVIIFGWSIIFAAMASIILADPFSFDSFMRLITLLVFFAFVRVLMNAGHYITAYAYRKTELLADYYAANLVGPEILINALIKIGQRGEVIRAINVELEWLDNQFEEIPTDAMAMRILHFMDPGEIDKQMAREFAIQFFVRAKMNQLFRGFRIQISDDQFNEYVTQATKNIMQQRGMDIQSRDDLQILSEQQLEEYTKSWKSADFDENDKLDREEIVQLVEDLRRENKTIFETEALEKMGVLPGTRTHPQVSQRIFFLYDNTMRDN